MQALPPLNARFVDLGFMVLGGVLVYLATRQLGNVLDQTAKQATQDAGQALAELTQWWNGSHDVEFTPIVYRSHYFNADYTLTDEARAVLWKVPQYQEQLTQVFGGPESPMKPEYRSLIVQSN